MWLRSGVAVAVAVAVASTGILIQPLTWELSYAAGTAVKRKKKKSHLPLASPYILVTFPQYPLFVQPSLKNLSVSPFLWVLFVLGGLPCHVKHRNV